MNFHSSTGYVNTVLIPLILYRQMLGSGSVILEQAREP